MIVILSDAQVKVATTFPLVKVDGLYSTLAVGPVVSIHVTVATVSQVFPASSIYSNVNTPSQVNVY